MSDSSFYNKLRFNKLLKKYNQMIPLLILITFSLNFITMKYHQISETVFFHKNSDHNFLKTVK